MLHELAAVKTADETVWLVHGVLGKRLVCRPKYVKRKGQTVRLFSPLFHCEMRQAFAAYQPYDTSGIYEGLYLIDAEAVTDCRTFRERISTKSRTGQLAKRTLERILKETDIPGDRIGFVGSLIWHCEKDGYSDINFAIMGDPAYELFQARCEAIQDMHFRTEREWNAFYDQYHVVGAEREAFVRISGKLRQQGTIERVPFTVFHIREELPVYRAMEKISVKGGFGGTFAADQATAGYFPILGRLMTVRGVYRITIWNRFYCGFFPQKARVWVEGRRNGDQIIVTPSDKIEIMERL